MRHRLVLFIFIYVYASSLLSADGLWLQDTHCIVLGANGNYIKSKPGSLIHYVCAKDKNEVTCSNTSANKEDTFAGKPSTLTHYIIINQSPQTESWMAKSHFGRIELSPSDQRFSAVQIYLTPTNVLITKHCIGIIKHLEDEHTF